MGHKVYKANRETPTDFTLVKECTTKEEAQELLDTLFPEYDVKCEWDIKAASPSGKASVLHADTD